MVIQGKGYKDHSSFQEHSSVHEHFFGWQAKACFYRRWESSFGLHFFTVLLDAVSKRVCIEIARATPYVEAAIGVELDGQAGVYAQCQALEDLQRCSVLNG